MTFGALNNEVVGSHTDDEWQALVRKYGWRCFYCGNPVSAWKSSDGRTMQIRNRNAQRQWESSGKFMAQVEIADVQPENILTKDHLIPTSRGGVDFIDNIRPADLRCNRLKGTKTVSEFLSERFDFIMRWIASLPVDDWRVSEWEKWQSDEEVERAIDDRLAGRHGVRIPQTVQGRAQKPTGVFALDSSFDSDFDVDVEKNKGVDFAFVVAPSPVGTSLEEKYDEPGLLKRVINERERISWAWKNPA